MKIKSTCCIDVGKVGRPNMNPIAQKCMDVKVTHVDINEAGINVWKEQDSSKLPVYKPGLDGIVSETGGTNVFLPTNVHKEIDESDTIFISLNSPTQTYGKGNSMTADLRYIEHLFSIKYFKELSTEDLHKSEFMDFTNLIRM